MSATNFQKRPSPDEPRQAVRTFLQDNMGVPAASGAGITFAQMGVDSMAILKILLFLEREFGIYLPDSDLTWENIRSPDALARVAARLAADPAASASGPDSTAS